MIVVDGVRYILRTPSNEDDLEQMVREHTEDIWGENSVYFDKKKLHTPAGIGSIPDGYVVVFGATPQWFVVEVELSSHQLYEHIVPQISKFASSVSNTASQSQIANAIHKTIDQDEILKAWVRTKIGNTEVYKFLMETVCRPPVLAIVIDEKTDQLNEVCDQLPAKFKSIEVVEFKTFQRAGSDPTVHAHLFEPLHRIVDEAKDNREKPVRDPRPILSDNRLDQNVVLEITLRSPTCIKYNLFHIPTKSRSFFPGYEIPFRLLTDVGPIETRVSSAPNGTEKGDPKGGSRVRANLAGWYKAHPELLVGSKILIKAIEPMKVYRLEVV